MAFSPQSAQARVVPEITEKQTSIMTGSLTP
jgi:hypothetical protein